MHTYIAGIDEAGRGPVIGPMVMTIAAIDEEDLDELEQHKITDSKAYTPKQRTLLLDTVTRLCEHETIILEPTDIDQALLTPGRNLNILEAETSAKLIDQLIGRLGAYTVKKVILDCPSTNPQAYLEEVKKRVKHDVQLQAEHKADEKYRIVGAASIIAKTTRDQRIKQLKQRHHIDFGSGYPSDPKTASFIRQHHDDYDFFRKTWNTYKRVAVANQQHTLATYQQPLSETTKQRQQQLQRLIDNEHFTNSPTKGTAELLRIKRPGITITLYRNGKLLFQGKNKQQWEQRLDQT